MLGRIGRRYVLAVLVATAITVSCGGSDDDLATATSESVPDTEPDSTTTSAIEDAPIPTTSQTTIATEPAGPEQEPEPFATFDRFIERWDTTAAELSENPDLAPTISAADVAPDPTIGVDVFVEQVTSQTVIGGIVDPETGTVTGLMGLSEPDSDDTSAMIEIIWVGAFGVDDRAMMGELFTVEEIGALQIGEQITRIHRGRSVVMNYVAGADPEGGLLIFTVGEEGLLEEDPSHDSITNVVLGLLVRTA